MVVGCIFFLTTCQWIVVYLVFDEMSLDGCGVCFFMTTVVYFLFDKISLDGCWVYFLFDKMLVNSCVFYF